MYVCLVIIVSSIRDELTRSGPFQRSIPTIGPVFPLFSYIGVFRFIRDAKGMVQEGYDRVSVLYFLLRLIPHLSHSKYKGGLFRVAEMNHWTIVATGQYAEEMRRAPEEVVSSHAAISEVSLWCPSVQF